MSSKQLIDRYIRIVNKQVEWRLAHNAIKKELTAHIEDQASAYMNDIESKEDAYKKAIQSMGNAVLVGKEYNKTYRPIIEWKLLIVIFFMFITSFIVNFISIRRQEWYEFQFSLDLVVGLTSLFVLVYLLRVSYAILVKNSKSLYFMLTVVTVVLCTLGLDESYHQFSTMRFYSTGLFLIYIPLITANLYHIKRMSMKSLTCLIIPVILSLVTLNLSCTIIIIFSYVIVQIKMTKLGSYRIDKKDKIIFLTVIVLLIVATLIVKFNISSILHYRFINIKALDKNVLNSQRIAILKGSKLLGKAHTVLRTGPFSNYNNNNLMILFIISNYGYIPFLVLSSIILYVILKALALSNHQYSIFGKLLGYSIVTTYSLQVVFYYLFNLGLNLAFPLTLPLLSYGKLSLIYNIVLFGLLLSVFRSGHVEEV